MKHLIRDRISTWVQIMLVVFLLGYSAVKGNPESKENLLSRPAEQTASTRELKAQMVELWEQHVAWNRNVMLCIVDELPGTEQAVERLRQNKIEIGDAIKPYYGAAAGDELTDLLYTHVTISAEVITFAKAQKNAELQDANQRWYANADSIAGFLASANPYWALEDIKLIIKDQLTLTTNQAVYRIQKDYSADVIAYDKAHADVLKMANIFADGIAKQFPEKFKNDPEVLMVKY